MFDQPPIRHDTDNIQAVIPYILPDWIIEIRDLPEADADWETEV